MSASSWFYYKKNITMHGHMNVKYVKQHVKDISIYTA
jgi:hypothetical protein